MSRSSSRRATRRGIFSGRRRVPPPEADSGAGAATTCIRMPWRRCSAVRPPIASSNEGDWKELHEQATSDIVVAHSWFRSLSGLDYASGFNAERILHEYEVALNTVILSAQEELLDPLKAIMEEVLREECDSLAVVNRPPTRSKPLYMKVWEARKADGLDYDPENELEQLFVAQITKYAMRNID